MRRRLFITKIILVHYKYSLNLISQNHRNMSEKKSTDCIKQSTEDLLEHSPINLTQSDSITHNFTQVQTCPSNTHSIFITHQQKIQATYNFQSLFRKKSHIYNMHKNKKKLLSKNQKNQTIKSDDPDKDSKNVKKGHWTPQQNRKYHWFLQLHNKHFILKHLRRTDKIFKTMSAFIGTREAQQCRSHHQKMQKKYKNFYHIIVKLRMEFYGTCETNSVKVDLQENGYIKENKDSLIQEDTLKSIQNRRQSKDSDNNSEKKQGKKLSDDEQDLMNMHDCHNENIEQQENQDRQNEDNLFFGQNYQKQLNYKLY